MATAILADYGKPDPFPVEFSTQEEARQISHALQDLGCKVKTLPQKPLRIMVTPPQRDG
ncbi:MAG: hypothetical protein ACAH95_01400 [Fimbriimonas sp.]